jgi:hypothetical protein
MPGFPLTHEAATLLDLLDQRSRASEGGQHRRANRYSFRRELELKRHDPEGGATQTWVFTRDFSAGGITCLHLAPMAVGTAVTVHLSTVDGATDKLPAWVVHCRQLKDNWYVLGLKFSEPVDPLRYV